MAYTIQFINYTGAFSSEIERASWTVKTTHWELSFPTTNTSEINQIERKPQTFTFFLIKLNLPKMPDMYRIWFLSIWSSFSNSHWYPSIAIYENTTLLKSSVIPNIFFESDGPP